MSGRINTFVGLDCETTGSDWMLHRLIQIGVYALNEDPFVEHVGWQEFEYDQEALRVIRVKPEDIKIWPTSRIVDSELCLWAEERKTSDNSLIPVGWGVSGFDMPFVRYALPLFCTKYLSHRSVELNAICYTLERSKTYLGANLLASDWKKKAKRAAELWAILELAVEPAPHDACYDALTSLAAWNWMCQVIRCPFPAANTRKCRQFNDWALHDERI